ncbi:Cysteine--tRNA ligase [Geodia barretti]|uniref:Cysteine--tRNA ligase, cytoplasmic n=3 Tax=Geodia barretti TaxID=519541 RepID=A0AA35WXB8_GEOBA|nr:Cysteine--tRNA ligase [Geodia barretti]
MKLYNTLTGDATEFTPADGKTVKMYVCGVTPYSSTHIGHALSYVAFDVLRRYVEHLGFEVRHVQNFTDVDDKIIQRAQEQGIEPTGLAEQFIEDFFQTMDALNIKRAHVYPRATEEIGPIIETIGKLVDSGYAYAAGGDVFFRVERSEDYGKLSHRTLEGMQAGSRIEIDENKEHPMDFALWKGARPGEPSWESPWGPGRPGWHIECTSMSMSYLGESLDIHGGGQDLVFPHHENEIAQSEASTGVIPFSRYWVHNGLLRLGEDKMSKSLGNLVSVEEALQRFSPDTIRLYFLSSHYRSPLSYTDDGCAGMERSLERLRNALTRDGGSESDILDPEPYQRLFFEAMDEDLNTPRALAALFDLARDINRSSDAGQQVSDAQDSLRHLGGILGLTFEAPEGTATGAGPFIELLLETRTALRQARQFEHADRIRNGLEQLGVSVEDSPSGSVWHMRRS